MGFLDGAGDSAQFRRPRGVAIDREENVIVTDTSNHRIRKITPDGVVSTLAGSGTRGFQDGAGGSAQFNNPYGVAVDGEGNTIVADTFNHRIRKIELLLWQPTTHHLFPPAVQSRVLLLMLVQARSARGPLAMPADIWALHIIPYMPWRWS